MNYRPIIKIINTAVINENSAALFHAPIFKNNLFNAKYVPSCFSLYEPQEKY